MTALVAAAGATLAACGAADGGAMPGPSAAQVRADTIASVARRIYRQEADGEVGHVAVKRIARDRALLAALRTDDPSALRKAALRQLFDPGKHVVRLSVRRGDRTVVGVGGAFVVAPTRRALPGRLGTLEASMQDVIGYVKLVRRLTGANVIVRGTSGQVESSLPAGTPISRYVVRSFTEPGYDGERLTVCVLT